MTDLDRMLATARETVRNLFPDLPPMTDEEAARVVDAARLQAVETAANYLAFSMEDVTAETCRLCSAPNGTTPGCLACASKRRYDRHSAPRGKRPDIKADLLLRARYYTSMLDAQTSETFEEFKARIAKDTEPKP